MQRTCGSNLSQIFNEILQNCDFLSKSVKNPTKTSNFDQFLIFRKKHLFLRKWDLSDKLNIILLTLTLPIALTLKSLESVRAD